MAPGRGVAVVCNFDPTELSARLQMIHKAESDGSPAASAGSPTTRLTNRQEQALYGRRLTGGSVNIDPVLRIPTQER